MANGDNEGYLAEVVSLFAHRRGGPGNFDGSGYQVLTTVRLMLEWLAEAWSTPGPAGLVCCEPRYLVDDGQVGFDIGLREGVSEDDLVEVKLNPTWDEVEAVVASARVLSESGGHPATARLVSARRTTAFTALEHLAASAREARDAEHFEALIRADPDERVHGLYVQLGEDPMSAASRLGAPTWCGNEENERRVTLLARSMSDDAQGLVDRLFRKFHAGAASRLRFSLRELVDELTSDGLLVEQTRVDISGLPTELVAALVVLQVCPLPVPAGVVAEAVGLSEDDARDLLAEQVSGGFLILEDDAYWAPPRSPRLDIRFGSDALVASLRALNLRAERLKDRYAEQVPNAVALARMVADLDLPTVAFTFKAFDKACKAWGDLSATLDLAELSDRALIDLLAGELTDDQQRLYASWRAQTFICGQGWVYQRVDRLGLATDYMRRAKEITDQYDDAENRAFALKCEGRLLRMDAESLDEDDPARADKLAASADLLERALPAFEALLLENPRFDEDPGECVSLLARTVATQRDLDRAAVLADEARRMLSALPASKAMADVVVLLAEIDLAQRPGDAVSVLADHGEALRRLLGLHGQDIDGRLDRSRSEITARVREVLATLELAVGNEGEGHRLLLEAAEQYARLGYDGRRDQMRWHAQIVSGQQAPEELMTALTATQMPDGARLRVIDRYWERYGAMETTAAGEASPPPLNELIIDSMVRAAIREHVAASAVFGERASSA